MERSRSFAPLIAAVSLLLPVLYVGTYLALVVPGGIVHHSRFADGSPASFNLGLTYRSNVYWAGKFFYPLEQIDRKLRPGAWEPLITESGSFFDRR